MVKSKSQQHSEHLALVITFAVIAIIFLVMFSMGFFNLNDDAFVGEAVRGSSVSFSFGKYFKNMDDTYTVEVRVRNMEDLKGFQFVLTDNIVSSEDKVGATISSQGGAVMGVMWDGLISSSRNQVLGKFTVDSKNRVCFKDKPVISNKDGERVIASVRNRCIRLR